MAVNTPASATFPGTNGRLVYYNFDGDPQQIFSILPDGTSRLRLTDTTRANNELPAWSADGTKIAFFLYQPGRGESLRTMNADGTGVSVVVRRPLFHVGSWSGWGVAWSADGTRLTFCAAREDTGGLRKIFVVNVDGTGLTQLSPADDSTNDCDPSWSPDGTEIAFDTVDLSGPTVGPVEIDVMRPDGSHRTAVVSNGFSPDWSPDGTKLIFLRFVGHQTDVFEVNSDGTGLTQITHTPKREEFDPVYSPDGTKTAFTRTRLSGSSENDIWVANADGTGSQRITSTRLKEEYWLSWQAT